MIKSRRLITSLKAKQSKGHFRNRSTHGNHTAIGALSALADVGIGVIFGISSVRQARPLSLRLLSTTKNPETMRSADSEHQAKA
jgi:hypothetical protein